MYVLSEEHRLRAKKMPTECLPGINELRHKTSTCKYRSLFK